MKFETLAGLILFTLMSCSSIEELSGNQPIIDTKGVSLARLDTDLIECEAYADEVQIGHKAVAGVVSGAAIGGLLGAVWGNSNTAQRGAGVGAVGGGSKGVVQGLRERDHVIKRCLSGRGYRVLN
jgi:outer membrane lipoprotein SlyB